MICTADDLVYTYEALRLVSESTYPFCFDQVKSTISDFLNCTNDTTCARSIVCQEIRQEYCTSEWRILELNGSSELVDCSVYGETAPLNCSDQFGLAHNGSVCLPVCDTFSQYTEGYTSFLPAWLAVCSALNVIGGIISLVVSVYKIKKL